jgi:hypothetical protein
VNTHHEVEFCPHILKHEKKTFSTGKIVSVIELPKCSSWIMKYIFYWVKLPGINSKFERVSCNGILLHWILKSTTYMNETANESHL